MRVRDWTFSKRSALMNTTSKRSALMNPTGGREALAKGNFRMRVRDWTFSKWWRCIGNCVATYIVIINAQGISAELLGTYLAIISGTEIFKIWLNRGNLPVVDRRNPQITVPPSIGGS